MLAYASGQCSDIIAVRMNETLPRLSDSIQRCTTVNCVGWSTWPRLTSAVRCWHPISAQSWQSLCCLYRALRHNCIM